MNTVDIEEEDVQTAIPIVDPTRQSVYSFFDFWELWTADWTNGVQRNTDVQKVYEDESIITEMDRRNIKMYLLDYIRITCNFKRHRMDPIKFLKTRRWLKPLPNFILRHRMEECNYTCSGRLEGDFREAPEKLTDECEVGRLCKYPLHRQQDLYILNKKEYADKLKDLGYSPPDPFIAEALLNMLVDSVQSKRDKGLYLGSNPGTGKSFAMKIYTMFHTAKIITAEQIVQDYKERLPDEQSDFWLFYTNVDHLIIDELGDEIKYSHYKESYELIEKVLKMRYNVFLESGKITSITSNADADMIKKRYGDKIHSRLDQMMEIVLFEGVDLRRQDNQEKT